VAQDTEYVGDFTYLFEKLSPASLSNRIFPTPSLSLRGTASIIAP
jgi:hypothetical protein